MRIVWRNQGQCPEKGGAGAGSPPEEESFALRLSMARRRLRRLLFGARMVVMLEQGMRLLWPVLAILGAYLGLAAAGIWELLPAAVAVAAFALAAVLVMLVAWRRWRAVVPLPSERAIMARLAHAGGVTQGMMAALFDRPVTGEPAFWRLHLTEAVAACRRVRLLRPRLVLPAEPRGLVAFGLLIFLTGLALGRGASWPRMTAALPPPLVREPAHVAMAAVIVPPAYTRLPPRPVIDGETADSPPVHRITGIPVGSRLMVTVAGGRTRPRILGPKAQVRLPRQQPERFAGEVSLTRSGRWAVMQGRRMRLVLDVELVPDRPPKLALARAPQPSRRGLLALKWKAEDDYGLKDGAVSFYADEAALKARRPFASLPLHPADEAGPQELSVTADLAADAHAGLPVLMQAVVRDARAQKAMTEPLRVVLPERQFDHPLAAAIAKLRRNLLRHPEQAPLVIAGLEAIRADHAGFRAHKTAYLGLVAAIWRLKLAAGADAIRQAAALLWQVALDLEDGGLTLAGRDMRTALEALAAALDGHGDLKAAMAAAEDAIARFLARLALEQLKAASSLPLADLAGVMEQAGRMGSRRLHDLMAEIRSLMKAGRREEAEALFRQLRAALEQAAAHPMTAEDIKRAVRMRRSLRDLARLVRSQENLHERTVQAALLASLLAERGIAFDSLPLAREQKDLRLRLEGIIKAMREAGIAPPAPLPRAGEAMDLADRALRVQAGGRASIHQNDALDALRQALDALRQQAQGMALTGTASPGLADPLGRPAGMIGGADLELPKGPDRRRLQEFMEAVRRRLADPRLDEEGRRYLERLLEIY